MEDDINVHSNVDSTVGPNGPNGPNVHPGDIISFGNDSVNMDSFFLTTVHDINGNSTDNNDDCCIWSTPNKDPEHGENVVAVPMHSKGGNKKHYFSCLFSHCLLKKKTNWVLNRIGSICSDRERDYITCGTFFSFSFSG